MQTFTVHACQWIESVGFFRDHVLTLEFDGENRTEALLSYIANKRQDLHNHFFIDRETKCNISFNVGYTTLHGDYRESRGIEELTYSAFEKRCNEVSIDPDFYGFSEKAAFCMWHKNKSGKARDYLIMKGLVVDKEYFDGSLFFDTSLQGSK